MMKLYSMEECPYCARVRRLLGKLGVAYQVVPVPRVGPRRTELLALPGIEGPEVPVLVDGDRVIPDSGAILEYLREKYADRLFGDPSWGLTTRLDGVSLDDALARVRAALAGDDFQVLFDLDMAASIDDDEPLPPYRVLGISDPELAERFFRLEPSAGLLLPLHLVLTEVGGATTVSVRNPKTALADLNHADLLGLVKDLRVRLVGLIAGL